MLVAPAGVGLLDDDSPPAGAGVERMPEAGAWFAAGGCEERGVLIRAEGPRTATKAEEGSGAQHRQNPINIQMM